jgi:hypothetical protein
MLLAPNGEMKIFCERSAGFPFQGRSERRTTWRLDTLQSRMTPRVVKELHTLGGTYR